MNTETRGQLIASPSVSWQFPCIQAFQCDHTLRIHLAGFDRIARHLPDGYVFRAVHDWVDPRTDNLPRHRT